LVLSIIPGLIKMSVVDWTMTREYKTHASGLFLRSDTRGDLHPTRRREYEILLKKRMKNIPIYTLKTLKFR